MEPQLDIAAYIPRLRRYARALVSDRAGADDLVQDALERAWARQAQFQLGTDLRAWLFSVMHNVYINQVRARRETTSLDGSEIELAVRATQGDVLEIRDLDRALQALPVEQREVLLLVALEDMSYHEAAHSLGIPVGTVMSRLARGREKLRVFMYGLGPSPKLQVVK